MSSPSRLLSSPYPDAFKQHKISANVSESDFAFLRNLYPTISNLHDAVLGNLYAGLIRYLRTELELTVPDDSAWDSDHSSIRVLRNALESFVRTGRLDGRPASFDSGTAASTPDVSGGTDSLHPTQLQPPQQRSSDQKSRDSENPKEKRQRRDRRRTSPCVDELIKLIQTPPND